MYQTLKICLTGDITVSPDRQSFLLNLVVSHNKKILHDIKISQYHIKVKKFDIQISTDDSNTKNFKYKHVKTGNMLMDIYIIYLKNKIKIFIESCKSFEIVLSKVIYLDVFNCRFTTIQQKLRL